MGLNLRNLHNNIVVFQKYCHYLQKIDQGILGKLFKGECVCAYTKGKGLKGESFSSSCPNIFHKQLLSMI